MTIQNTNLGGEGKFVCFSWPVRKKKIFKNNNLSEFRKETVNFVKKTNNLKMKLMLTHYCNCGFVGAHMIVGQTLNISAV